ncbi:MAG: hypothetical protein PVI90_17600, partial [Desulfobacteraceae bacterium]
VQTPDCHIGSHAFGRSGIVADQKRVVAVDGESGIYHTLSKSPDLLYKNNNNNVSISKKCKGNLCILDKEKSTLYLVADLLGCFPLYYTSTKNAFAFSTRLRSFGKFLSNSHDIAGIVAFFLDGYTFNNRTLYKNISRLRPGEIIRVKIPELDISIDNYSKLWSTKKGEHSQYDIVDDATKLLRKTFDVDINTLLMMSAGWDSRTLLAAGVANKKLNKLTTYSHGDLYSRECKIVDHIAKLMKVELVKQSINTTMYDPDILHKNLDYTENVIFPHWHCAGERAKEIGVLQVAAGIFGEAFGGHYGPPMMLKGINKAISTGKYLLNLQYINKIEDLKKDALQNAYALLKLSNLKKPWFISDDFWESNVKHIINTLNEDIKTVLERYKQRGIEKTENYIEAFITEHRGAQYVSAQLLSCRHHVDICLPYADRELIEFATAVPFHKKVHNILNQAVINNVAPQLLEFPMAATLLSAKYPIIQQEASRATRKLIEDLHWKIHKISKGAINEPRLGWVNFQFLSESRHLHEIIDSLQQPYWDKKKMASYIDDTEHISFHPISDMLMKLLTIEYCLNNH